MASIVISGTFRCIIAEVRGLHEGESVRDFFCTLRAQMVEGQVPVLDFIGSLPPIIASIHFGPHYISDHLSTLRPETIILETNQCYVFVFH